MALTESNPMSVGTLAPNFSLLNPITGDFNELQKLRGAKGTVVMFICNHCPYVVHVNEQLVSIATEYQQKGIQFIAICSNNVELYPADSPDNMVATAERLQYPFPYLYDETQEVAKAYDAACTPDFYLFDQELKAVYHGELDRSRPGNEIPVTGEALRQAMDLLLAGEEPLTDQFPSIGCNIKWK